MKNFFELASNYTLNKEQIEVEKLREEFIKIFDEIKLKSMTIDEYALNNQTHSKTNFCYWVENKLNGLGCIYGSTAHKFGVYFGVTKADPTLKWRWESWTNEEFDKIKEALLDLYIAGKIEDIEQIKKNPLRNIFKGKILSIYFPERYLNIYAEYHLVYFLDKLNISHKNIKDPVDLREKLIEFKNSHNEFSHFSAIEFGYFLYSYFGKPKNEEIKAQLKEENEFYDNKLNIEVNNEILKNRDIQVLEDMPNEKPEKIPTATGITYKRNKNTSLQALAEAQFLCEIDNSHESFIRKDGRHKYTEPHHIIPMKYQDSFENSLDVKANIISLCSNCHNWLHYGCDYEKLLKDIYDKRINRLKKVGLNISFSQLKKYYNE